MAQSISKADIARDLIRRKRCRDNLHSFALNIDIPTAPNSALCPDEELTGPASALYAKHHSKILDVAMRTILRPYGRAIIMAPPGSAKSTYVSVVVPPWAMGRINGTRIIMTSYASNLIQRQSRRARGICEQQLYRDIWAEPITVQKDSDPEWSLSNGSELLCAGLLAGITGSRANGAIVDDPVAGRAEADSPTERLRTLNAYQDDLMTRLLPGAWVIIVMTRWNEQDLVGEILPHDYKGQSGMIQCRDGLEWEVLNLPAKAEHLDDPIGRKPGEYLWTDYYPPKHWQMFENGAGSTRQRTWSSLYQQRPSPQGSGKFTREMFEPYYYDTLPESARRTPRTICSDFAVSEGKNDFTEHGVWTVDSEDTLFAVDWFYEQCDTGRGLDQMLRMVEIHRCLVGFNEGGVIDKAIRPGFITALRDWNAERKKRNLPPMFIDLRALPSIQDKLAKLSPFQARASVGKVRFPRNAPWSERVIMQLLAMPAGRHDDAADVCGLAGRGLEQTVVPTNPQLIRKVGLKPYTAAWLEWQENLKPAIRYR